MTASMQRAQPDTLKRLDARIGHVPMAVAQGSWNLSVDFKSAMVKAIKARHTRGLTEVDASLALRGLERFWE